MDLSFKNIKTFVAIALGMFLYALGVTAFLIPAKIAGGGVTGIATLIYFSTGISTGISYLVINVFLILLAIRALGASFGVKTVFGMGVMTFFLSMFEMVFTEPFLNDMFLSSILGGMICGIGLGIAFVNGGSSGGTDIIAMLVNKYYNVSPGRVILLCDVAIVGSSFFIFHTFDKMVYGFVSMAVVSYSIDAFLNGSKQSTQMFIFSKQYQEIADFICTERKRGVTVFDGTGWYTQKEVKVVMTVIRKREAVMIFKKIREIDPEAFISQNSVMGVYGHGFDKLKY